jgi:DNA-binding transcriptional LysR family regulator
MTAIQDISMSIGRISDIDLRWLHVFITVVRCGGYSAAQAELNIGLATISSHMKSLESRLGVRLCQRGRAGFSLTEDGQLVYEEAVMLANSLERFSSLSQTLGVDLSGKLQMGAVDTITSAHSTLIIDTIKKFNERENRVQINLHIASRKELEKAVLDGTYDLAIGPFATHYSGLKVRPLYNEVHALFCGKGHTLFGRKDLKSATDLVGEAISARAYAAVDDCERAGTQNRRAVVNHLEAQLALLLSGGYIGYLPVHYAAAWVKSGKLWELNAPSLSYKSPHVLISRQSKSLSKPVLAFIDDLLAANQEFQAKN